MYSFRCPFYDGRLDQHGVGLNLVFLFRERKKKTHDAIFLVERVGHGYTSHIGV